MSVFVDEGMLNGAYRLGNSCRPTKYPYWIIKMGPWLTQATFRYETYFPLLEEVHEGGRCADNKFRRVDTLLGNHNHHLITNIISASGILVKVLFIDTPVHLTAYDG